MMNPDREPTQVTLEDLLRIKRSERPSPEFWARFEQDLRAKQLAAIVEKRPWWHALRLPQAARVLARLQVPVGSAAVLALSFVVVSHYRGQPASPATPAAAPALAMAAVPHTAPVNVQPSFEHTTLAAAVAPAMDEHPAFSAPKTIEPINGSTNTQIAADATAPAQARSMELTAMVPWGLSMEDGGVAARTASSAPRLLQAGLQVAATPDLGVTSLLASTPVEERASAQATQAAPAAEVRPAVVQAVAVAAASPREVRRAKILAGLVLADNGAGAADYTRAVRGREIAVNDISEDQLYDSARRLGVDGDRFTLKF